MCTRTARDFIGWKDIRGDYRTDSTTVSGVTSSDDVLTGPGSTRLFDLANQRDYSLMYDGFTVMVEKRLSHGWYANGSYTRSHASGLQPSGGTTAAGAQVATTGAPPVSFAPPVTFGRDPNSLTNAGGRLPNDRPNLFRLMAAVDLPGTGINVAATVQYSTGKPGQHRRIMPSQAQGATRVLLEERGTQRCPPRRCWIWVCRELSHLARRDASISGSTFSTCSMTPLRSPSRRIKIRHPDLQRSQRLPRPAPLDAQREGESRPSRPAYLNFCLRVSNQFRMTVMLS